MLVTPANEKVQLWAAGAVILFTVAAEVGFLLANRRQRAAAERGAPNSPPQLQVAPAVPEPAAAPIIVRPTGGPHRRRRPRHPASRPRPDAGAQPKRAA